MLRTPTLLVAVLSLALAGAARADEDVEPAEQEEQDAQEEQDEAKPRRGISVAEWDLVTDDVLAARQAAWQAEGAAFCSSLPSNVNPGAWAHWCATQFHRPAAAGVLPQERPPAPLPAQHTSGGGLPSSSSFAPMDPGIADEARQRSRHDATPPAREPATRSSSKSNSKRSRSR